LKQKSDVDGVASSNNNVVKNTVDIRPRIFLNILHSVLKGKELEFPLVDPFFHQEDYDLVEEDDNDDDGDGDGDGDDDTGNNKESFGMKDLMVCIQVFFNLKFSMWPSLLFSFSLFLIKQCLLPSQFSYVLYRMPWIMS
jgi:hypothetical protein